MSGCTAPSTRLGNTLELTSPGTSSYGIIRSGSTPRSGTEPRTRWSGNGMISTQQREITGIPCPENCGPLTRRERVVLVRVAEQERDGSSQPRGERWLGSMSVRLLPHCDVAICGIADRFEFCGGHAHGCEVGDEVWEHPDVGQSVAVEVEGFVADDAARHLHA